MMGKGCSAEGVGDFLCFAWSVLHLELEVHQSHSPFVKS